MVKEKIKVSPHPQPDIRQAKEVRAAETSVRVQKATAKHLQEAASAQKKKRLMTDGPQQDARPHTNPRSVSSTIYITITSPQTNGRRRSRTLSMNFVLCIRMKVSSMDRYKNSF